MNATELPPKKAALLEAAMWLSMEKGFSATTIDDMCTKASVTKGSFFHYFKTKEDMGEALLLYYEQYRLQPFADMATVADLRERFNAYIDLTAEFYSDPLRGSACLVAVFTQEYSETVPRFQQLVEVHFNRWQKRIEFVLRPLLSKHAPHLADQSGAIAQHFITVLQGALLLAKAHQDYRIVSHQLMMFKQYFALLLDA